MGNRARSCIYNTLMQYHSGMLAVAFTASAPRELFQEELLVTAGAVRGVIHLLEKWKFFPCLPLVSLLCLKALLVCSFKCTSSIFHEIKNINAWFFFPLSAFKEFCTSIWPICAMNCQPQQCLEQEQRASFSLPSYAVYLCWWNLSTMSFSR